MSCETTPLALIAIMACGPAVVGNRQFALRSGISFQPNSFSTMAFA